MKRALRVATWNVNGLRACARKGFLDWLANCRADVVALQEVRALREDLGGDLCDPRGWFVSFNAAERRGYSGVAIYSRRQPDAVWTSLLEPRFDREGRLMVARFGRLVIANGYFPKGSGTARDNSRVPYKLAFYRKVLARVQRLRRAGYRVLVAGDFNTAHQEIDLARPRQNVENSGFLPEERAEFERWIRAGWVDTFRHFEPGGGHYSWWSQRLGTRQRNIGWRIDYVLASPAAMRFVHDAFIWSQVLGSDHCPVGVELSKGADILAGHATKR
jgi:exodeoxyribonuclease-3